METQKSVSQKSRICSKLCKNFNIRYSWFHSNWLINSKQLPRSFSLVQELWTRPVKEHGGDSRLQLESELQQKAQIQDMDTTTTVLLKGSSQHWFTAMKHLRLPSAEQPYGPYGPGTYPHCQQMNYVQFILSTVSSHFSISVPLRMPANANQIPLT